MEYKPIENYHMENVIIGKDFNLGHDWLLFSCFHPNVGSTNPIDLALGLAFTSKIASFALAIINLQRPTLIPLVYSNPLQCFFAPTTPNHTFKLLEHGQTMPRLVFSPQADSCINFHT